MHKKLILIIGLQAAFIIALFWVLIFYSKDEYEAYQNSQQADIVSPNRVTQNQGINVVTLSLATQQNSGIQTAKLSKVTYQGAIKSIGNVVSLDSLIEAKTNYLNLKNNMNLARAASGNNLLQYQRLKALNADDKNVSDQVMQQALAAVNNDNANINAIALQLKNLQSSLALQWGDPLSTLVYSQALAPHLANLLSRKNVLVQISLPVDAATPKIGSSVNISPLNAGDVIIKASYISPAATNDSTGFGKTFYYSAPADLLRIGMRVNVEAKASNNSSNGVVIPSNAVVWYASKPWAYFKTNKDQFVRKPINADTEIDAGWFNPVLAVNGLDANGLGADGIDANAEVVVSGAQLLLSEEFKSQIKNENED